MRTLSIALLCLLFAGFCACGKTTTTATETTGTEETTTAITLTKVKIKTRKDDPYSFVAKERYESLFENSVEYNIDYISDRYYALYDIDGNGTKELLSGVDTDDFGYGIVITAIYTIQNGVAVVQEALPPWMEEFDRRRFLYENGTIKLEGFDETATGYAYLRFEAGELKYQIAVGIEYGTSYYKTTGKGTKNVCITEEEYNQLRKEFEDDGEEVKLDWKPLADYGK